MRTNATNRETIVAVLRAIKSDLGIDSVYSHYKGAHVAPYMTYIGSGQIQHEQDNRIAWRSNTFEVSYYFKKKDEDMETAVEDHFIAGGWHYDKSSDGFLEDLFYIIYDLS